MEPERLTIDAALLEKHNLTPGEFIIVLAALWKVDLDEAAHNMVKMGTARTDLGLVLPNQIAIERFYSVIADSCSSFSDEELLSLAAQMKVLYPKGKKPGTDQYWADGPALIVERLRTFFRKYGEYAKEDILEAERKYIKDMQDSPYMRTLRNFIYKEELGGTGTVEHSSDLYNYLVNNGEVSDAPDPEWTAQVK